MILKNNQRAGGSQLAAHLLKTEDNEHVHVHELRGFMSEDLKSAFHEAYAVSCGTRARQYLFSLSLSPPPNEQVPVDAFEAASRKPNKNSGWTVSPAPSSSTKRKDAATLMSSGPVSTWRT